jgi:hypothetical protein
MSDDVNELSPTPVLFNQEDGMRNSLRAESLAFLRGRIRAAS